MPAASWKGSIQFGPLVQFPVRAVSVDREVKFAFNTHHAKDGGRLRASNAICEVCGDPVPKEDVVRGYKDHPGIDDEYLKSLDLAHSGVMELDGLVPAIQIEPRWYRREYDVIAEPAGASTYELFRELLVEADRVAIGKVVTGGKEHIVVVRPRPNGIMAMNLLWWPEELKSDADAVASVAGVEVSEQTMVLGRKLVALMSKDFDPSEYRNEHAAAVGEYLEGFVNGTEPVKIDVRPQPESPAMSLEDALAASFAALGGEEPKKAKKKAGKAA